MHRQNKPISAPLMVQNKKLINIRMNSPENIDGMPLWHWLELNGKKVDLRNQTTGSKFILTRLGQVPQEATALSNSDFTLDVKLKSGNSRRKTITSTDRFIAYEIPDGYVCRTGGSIKTKKSNRRRQYASRRK